jgi:hypothetical protein
VWSARLFVGVRSAEPIAAITANVRVDENVFSAVRARLLASPVVHGWKQRNGHNTDPTEEPIQEAKTVLLERDPVSDEERNYPQHDYEEDELHGLVTHEPDCTTNCSKIK